MAHTFAERRLSLFRALALLFFICMIWAPALSGCAGQGQKVSGSNLKTTVTKSGDALARAAVNSGSGEVSISDGPYGRGWASVGEPYLSALGLPCRPVIFLSEQQERYDLAVCAESNGVWSTAPNIFAAKPAPPQGVAIEDSAESPYDRSMASGLLQTPGRQSQPIVN